MILIGPSKTVRIFFDLMLQIRNMSEDDLLFNFMDGLKPWAAQELKRHKVEDISTELTVVKTLVEYRPTEKGVSFKHKGKSPKQDISTELTVAETLVEYRSTEKGKSSNHKGESPKHKGTKPWHAKGGQAKR